jgi:hypothetical protein
MKGIRRFRVRFFGAAGPAGPLSSPRSAYCSSGEQAPQARPCRPQTAPAASVEDRRDRANEDEVSRDGDRLARGARVQEPHADEQYAKNQRAAAPDAREPGARAPPPRQEVAVGGETGEVTLDLVEYLLFMLGQRHGCLPWMRELSSTVC